MHPVLIKIFNKNPRICTIVLKHLHNQLGYKEMRKIECNSNRITTKMNNLAIKLRKFRNIHQRDRIQTKRQKFHDFVLNSLKITQNLFQHE